MELGERGKSVDKGRSKIQSTNGTFELQDYVSLIKHQKVGKRTIVVYSLRKVEFVDTRF